jgi:SAM-dependent methyltransferase
MLTINGIPLPPQEFMNAVAGAPVAGETHIAIGKEFFGMLTQRCKIQPTDRILDIGSGCGRIASHFAGHVTNGYDGLDIVLPMVEWCRANISSRYPNFSFHHAPLRNTHYSKTGGDAASYVFPFADATFDVIFVVSVFTNLMPAAVQQYAGEIARMLKPGGRSFFTFFLVTDDYRRRIAQGEQIPNFLVHNVGGGYVGDPANPEGTIAFDESDALGVLTGAKLRIEKVALGTWSKNPGWTYQDVILATR